MTIEELYKFAFPDGLDVIVIDDVDGFHWGKLETRDDKHIVLIRGSAATAIPWEHVRFMAQDDFDIRDVRGPFPKEDAVMEAIASGIRSALALASKRIQKPKRRPVSEAIIAPPPINSWRRTTIRFGDPYELDAGAEIHNVGNDGPEHYGLESSEVIALFQGDRIGLLWELQSVYEMA